MLDLTERHFTINELAEAWNISPDKCRELFIGEPGVLNFGKPPTRRKRIYRPIRIPASVAARVYARLTNSISA